MSRLIDAAEIACSLRFSTVAIVGSQPRSGSARGCITQRISGAQRA
jgi:hypothetical protein